MKTKRVAITTLGCKTNQFESAAMIEKLANTGYTIVPFDQQADIYLVNSCTVTAKTDVETRRLIRRAKRLNPNARVIATGCYAQVAPEELEKMPEIDSVIGNCEKEFITDFVESGIGKVTNIALAGSSGTLKLESFAEHTRAFLQVQNGCNSFCSYCIVPYARGRSRSVPVDQLISGIRKLAANDYKEIVLTGIHLGAYGLDLTPASSITELLQRINSERITERLRIGSLEPNELDDQLLMLIAGSDIICNHLHLPLQSGSDTVLKRMRRHYSSAYFRELIAKISKNLPKAFIGADLIAGFPGESETEFAETVRLVEELPFSDLHVFPYSKRSGTKAAAMPDQISPALIKERAAILRKIAKAKKQQFLEKNLGESLATLGQSFDQETGVVRGISRNYLQLEYQGTAELLNCEVAVKVETITGDSCLGRLV